MTTTINASTSAGLVQTADTSGILQLQTANTAAMTIDATQNVGVGTTVAPGGNGKGIAIYTSDYPRLSFRNSTTTDVAANGTQMYLIGNDYYQYNNQAAAQVFGTNSTERMRIDSAGNVGIGNTPSYKLDVTGSTFRLYNDSATILLQRPSNSRSGQIIVRDSSGALKYYAGTNGAGEASNVAHEFVSDAPTTGVVNAQINVYGIGLGANTPTSGIGIKFPATQSASSDANTLDDYEEGTWTVVPTFGGNNTGMTLSVQSGSYVKVGRTVFIQARVTFTNKGSSTGSFNFYGLPFTSASGNGFYSGVSISYQGNFNNGSTWSVQQHPVIDTNNTYILFRYANGSGGSADHNNNDVSNTSDIIVWGFYQTT